MRRVLRVLPGRQVIASNGRGGAFLCDTRAGGKEGVELIALESVISESVPPRLHMVLSLLKGKDLEEPVEGLCQLNIDAIHLVTTEHTQEFKGQNHDRLVERLRVKSLVGLKQAKKAWLTAIHEPVPLRDWRKSHEDMPLILVHPGEDTLPETPPETVGMLIGPEGGFSRAELEWLGKQECHNLGLGTTRIRGIHAPLLACGKLMGKFWL